MKDFCIAVAGLSYVGCAVSVALSIHHSVVAIDVIQEKVDKINHRIAPIEDVLLEEYLSTKDLHLSATTDPAKAYRDADFVIIAVNTDFDPSVDRLDTSAVETVVRQVMTYNPDAVIVIKSTVPIGYTKSLREKTGSRNLLFCPEFLREGSALFDVLNPSRIVVGYNTEDEDSAAAAHLFAQLLQDAVAKEDVKTLFMGETEAEAVKLFSNAYLAMRVSYFNEMDTYAQIKGLDAEEIVKGVCADPRIGDFYNNPSFGFGGYCLPKDVKQLLASAHNVPGSLIRATLESNQLRKEFIADHISSLHGRPGDADPKKSNTAGICPDAIGIYRLSAKQGSDDFRQSSILDVMLCLTAGGTSVILYEPALKEDLAVENCRVVKDLDEFKKQSRIILANRYNPCLDDVKDKVYTRDLFGRN